MNSARGLHWQPPADWLKISTIDAHAGGEALRVITGGVPMPSGTTLVERRRHAQAHLDGLRRVLMFEPRGHADMYGALLMAPSTDDGDAGVLFMHNEGWSTMCGHGVIGLTTVMLETGMHAAGETIRLDTPAGRVTAQATIENNRVTGVSFENVPSFVYALDAHVEVPGLGRVRYDLAFGGAFYAYVDAADVDVDMTPHDFRAMIEKGMAIKHAVTRSRAIAHPFEPDLSFLYGTIFVGAASGEGAHSRNVCVFAEGEVDRSPTGTGVSGRVALEYARGRLGEGQPFVVESIIGSRFTGRVIRTTTFGGYSAVVPQVEGRAWITGRHEFLVAPDDALKDGFILR